MSKYVFKKLPDDADKNSMVRDSTEVTVITDQVALSEILNEFKHFLMACGFIIDPGSDLEISPEELDP